MFTKVKELIVFLRMISGLVMQIKWILKKYFVLFVLDATEELAWGHKNHQQ